MPFKEGGNEMKPVKEMTMEEMSDELLETYRLPKSSLTTEAKARVEALEARYDAELTAIRNGPEIVNPEAFEEGEG